MKKPKLLVAKIGGNVIQDEKILVEFLEDFAQKEGFKILVHGGGKSATQLAERLNVKTEMIDGRRITSKENLDIVVMTYAGLVNKNIVAQLQSFDCNAIGLTGADANLILSEKRPVRFVDYGYVGDILKINAVQIDLFLQNGIVPVFCAVTHDKNGQLLNTNADTIASRIAASLSDNYEVSLYYCFELKGVLSDIKNEDSVIEHIDFEMYDTLCEKNMISDGMLPKLQNCFDALKNQVKEVHIANKDFLKNPKVKHTELRL